MFEYRIGTTWYTIDRELIPTQVYFQEKQLSLERDEGSSSTYLYGDGEVLPFAFEFQGRKTYSSPADLIAAKNWHQTNFPNVDRIRYQGRILPVLKAFFHFRYVNDHRQADINLKFIPQSTEIPASEILTFSSELTWGSDTTFG